MEKEFGTVLKVLGEKIEWLETMLDIKNMRIEQLEKQLGEQGEQKEEKAPF